jgi:hypothetical protein
MAGDAAAAVDATDAASAATSAAAAAAATVCGDVADAAVGNCFRYHLSVLGEASEDLGDGLGPRLRQHARRQAEAKLLLAQQVAKHRAAMAASQSAAAHLVGVGVAAVGRWGGSGPFGSGPAALGPSFGTRGVGAALARTARRDGAVRPRSGTAAAAAAAAASTASGAPYAAGPPGGGVVGGARAFLQGAAARARQLQRDQADARRAVGCHLALAAVVREVDRLMVSVVSTVKARGKRCWFGGVPAGVPPIDDFFFAVGWSTCAGVRAFESLKP